MKTSQLDTFPGPMAPRSGLELFFACQKFAKRYYRSSQGQAMKPGGARIFYYTRLYLLRLGVLPAVEPVATELPDEVVQRFLQEAPKIAAQLAADFGQATRLHQQPEHQLWRILAASAFLQPPELRWAPEHLRGARLQIQQSWKQFWEQYWTTTIQDHREEILRLVQPDRLLVVVVARPSDPDEKALAYLQERIALDQSRWPSGPPEEVYLYEQPLSEWLIRPLFTGLQLLHLYQAFATWLNHLPEIIHKRRAHLEQKSKQSISDVPASFQDEAPPALLQSRETLEGPADLPGELRRRLPLIPNGTVTGEALFYFAAALLRQAHQTERMEAIRPAGTPLEPGTFRALISSVLHVAEFLLWDEPQAIRLQAASTGDLHQALQESLLPRRLRQEYRTLLCKSRAQEDKQSLKLPNWPEWETLLGKITGEVATRLANTPLPAALTRERLAMLLEQPLPSQRGPYLYDRPFGKWCQTAFPHRLPESRQLFDWYRSLAEALGNWPEGIAGVPSSPASAARAIFWYTKLAVEARMGPALLREVTSSRLLSPTQSPQRADGGLAIWLDDPLPIAALSLASVLAPQVARVLQRMAWRAAHQSQPLLLAQLKAGDPKSWTEMEHFLQRQARSLGCSEPERAAWEATEKLQAEFLYLLLPSEISEGLLEGDRSLLQAAGWYDGSWYLHKQSSYHCLADVYTFARSFIRFSRSETDRFQNVMITSPAPPVASFEPPLMEEQGVPLALQLLTGFGRRDAADAGIEHSISSPATDQITLFRLLHSSQTARSIIADLALQQHPAAVSIQQEWEKSIFQTTREKQRHGLQRHGLKRSATFSQGKLAQALVLTRLFAEPQVQASPQVRRALADLLELSRGLDMQRSAAHFPVGVLERAAALALRPAWRAEVVKALEALSKLAEKQRQAIIHRLLKQEEVMLLLALLEGSGWRRPPWLPQEEHGSASREKERTSGGSVQLFHIGRVNWLKNVTDTHSAESWRARGLMYEWLGGQFWSGLGKGARQEQALPLYQITLAALPESLRLIVGAIWQVARKTRLAQLPEILGMAGALPPQLPAQLDAPAFFAAVLEFLLELPTCNSRQLHRLDTTQEQLAIHHLLRLFQVARCRTHLWLLGVLGLQRDQERKTMLAAAALANGNPQKFAGWLQGLSPSQEESSAMCKQIHEWHHQVVLAPDELTALLHSAGQQVAPAWARLRREVETRQWVPTA